jgi:hypothetical protein
MKRRDFLKIGVGTVLTVPMAVHGSVSQTIAAPIQYHDWSVKFRALNASITQETYAAFFNEEQRGQNPVGFLNYLYGLASLRNRGKHGMARWLRRRCCNIY